MITMKPTKTSLLILAFLIAMLVLPPAHSKSPYGGNQGNSKTTNVSGYTKKDGTVVAPYQRTTPNGTQRDNWSSKPNYNPNTGKEGTKEPEK